MQPSLISVLTRHFEDAAAPCPPTDPSELATLTEVLDPLPYPPRVRGRRYRLGSLLGLCLVAVLGGARSLAQIARFAADAAPRVLHRRIGPSAHSSGTNNRHCSGQDAVSETACTLTATWQLACLPSAPQCWCATATDIRPSLGNDTSSTAQDPGRSAAPSAARSAAAPAPDPRSTGSRTAAGSARCRPAAAPPSAGSTCAVRPDQPPQITVALGPLILPRHRGGHITYE